MNYVSVLFLLGRILYGGFFLLSGIKHFTQLQSMASYAASKGVVSPTVAVAGSGLLIILGGLGILFGIYVPISLLLIVLFLVPITLKMHAFWNDTDPQVRASNLVNFSKNIALLGAAFMLLSVPTPWLYSL